MIDFIKYKNSWYKVRTLEHPAFGQVCFGSTHLSNRIISKSGEAKSKEAEMIDDQIYFYLSPSLFRLSDKELMKRFF